MTTKHTPATPLPWRIVEERGNLPAIMKIAASGNLPAIFINGPRDELMVGGGIYARSIDKLYNRTGWWQDAAYIAHAANAYPLLVKAVAGGGGRGHTSRRTAGQRRCDPCAWCGV